MTNITQNALWIVAYLKRYNGPLDRVYCVIEHNFIRDTRKSSMEFETAIRYARRKQWVADRNKRLTSETSHLIGV